MHRPAWHISLGEKRKARSVALYTAAESDSHSAGTLRASARAGGGRERRRTTTNLNSDGGQSGRDAESTVCTECVTCYPALNVSLKVQLSRVGTRLVASTSSAPAFHSSAVAQATTMRARRAATANAKIREDREREAALSRPHIVLGHRPGDDAKWHNCDLAKILVTEQDILAAPPLPHTVPENGEVPVPKYTNYGVQEAEQSRLFETLPVLTVEAHVQSMLDHAKKENRNVPLLPQEMVPLAQVAQQSGEEKELAKAVMLARLVDLRNANARGIAYENRRRCVAAFSAPGNPNDTGRPEVQGTSRRNTTCQSD